VNLLVTGRPGSGKTTVVERIVASLPRGVATGFFTREARERGMRRGFTMETLDGRTAVLADVGGDGPRVGRYRVRLRELEAVGVPALGLRPGVRLIVVDEIGRMECLSQRFCDAVRQALDAPTPVLGTIPRQGGRVHRGGPRPGRRHDRGGDRGEPRPPARDDPCDARPRGGTAGRREGPAVTRAAPVCGDLPHL